jgi:hypothetical protein
MKCKHVYMEIIVHVYPKHIFHCIIINHGIDRAVMNVGKVEELNHL